MVSFEEDEDPIIRGFNGSIVATRLDVLRKPGPWVKTHGYLRVVAHATAGFVVISKVLHTVYGFLTSGFSRLSFLAHETASVISLVS